MYRTQILINSEDVNSDPDSHPEPDSDPRRSKFLLKKEGGILCFEMLEPVLKHEILSQQICYANEILLNFGNLDTDPDPNTAIGVP